ncbi:transcription termination factor NusA [Rickettsiales bacterium]|nr:transcription termination factor NusA [Rickettsiales bacterium]
MAVIGNTEILQIADAVAREKSIDREVIIEAMESSMAIAARKKYGYDRNIRATIDRKNGEIKLFRETEIVDNDYVSDAEEDEDEESFLKTKIYLKDALEIDPEAKVGGFIRDALPPIDLGRVAAQTAKQVIVQKVRDAERERQYEDFKHRIGEIINGTVKRVEFGDVIVDIGNAEAIIKRNSLIRGEMLRVNDRIRAYIEDVRRELKGPQIFLSRSANEFMAKLFTQEVPEIYDGIIEIKSVAREPGSRAKIAVTSNDSSIDPVGSCVGMRGARVQAVINELQGEKIDIVKWSPDTAIFLVSALAPAEVTKVVIDEDKHRIEAVVPDDQLSLAIGRRGQNVRLASQLVGWGIDVMTEADESDRRVGDFNKYTEMFAECLNIEEIMAQLLVSEGFNTLEEVAFVELNELSSIEGFDEEIAEELQNRAKEYLEQKEISDQKKLKDLKVSDDLASIEGLSSDTIILLGENGIKTLDDFADLARDEFIEIVPNSGLSNDEIDKLIMQARAHWFDEENEQGDKQANK